MFGDLWEGDIKVCVEVLRIQCLVSLEWKIFLAGVGKGRLCTDTIRVYC